MHACMRWEHGLLQEVEVRACPFSFIVLHCLVVLLVRLIPLLPSSATDINECTEGSDRCSHYCINEEGGYRCTCPTKLFLATDGLTCEGQTHECTVLSAQENEGSIYVAPSRVCTPHTGQLALIAGCKHECLVSDHQSVHASSSLLVSCRLL